MRVIKGTQDAKRIPKGLVQASNVRTTRCHCGRQALATGNPGEYKCACGAVLRAKAM